MIKCVSSVTKTLIDPPVPAGTIAAFATTVPVGSLSVDTNGCAEPVGHVVRKLRVVVGTAVMLSEYAAAVAGNPHVLDNTGTALVELAARIGPPSGLVGLRVSITRHGVTGK